MKFNPRHVVIGLLLAVGFASGCGKGTYLVVDFIGRGSPDIHIIAVELALTNSDGGVTYSRGRFPEKGVGPKIILPTSVAFSLDDYSGPLTITASALGPEDQVLATAPSQTTTIMHDKTWTVVVDFGSGN